jgi:hypothetical protein
MQSMPPLCGTCGRETERGYCPECTWGSMDLDSLSGFFQASPRLVWIFILRPSFFIKYAYPRISTSNLTALAVMCVWVGTLLDLLRELSVNEAFRSTDLMIHAFTPWFPLGLAFFMTPISRVSLWWFFRRDIPIRRIFSCFLFIVMTNILLPMPPVLDFIAGLWGIYVFFVAFHHLLELNVFQTLGFIVTNLAITSLLFVGGTLVFSLGFLGGLR